LKSTITFIVPIQTQQEFLIEQLNAIFKFSEHYQGFCEIILPTDEINHPKLNLIMLAIKLNKITHPYVRTRTIYYIHPLGLKNLIETSINHALGDKIVITLNMPEKIENLQINNFMDKNIIITKYILDTHILQQNLAPD